MNSAHQHGWQIFEVVFGIPFLIAIALQLILPLSLPYGSLAPAIIVVGIAFIVLGIRAHRRSLDANAA